jgi:DNA-binding transcriptional LysR family regulator
MHRMDWDAVRAFLAVARMRRVSLAARHLGVEHTTVSRRLAALERDLGAPLFHRTTAGYLLTDAGKDVLPAAEAMERAATGIDTRVREITGKMLGRVRLALAPEFASHWLAPRLPEFRARYRDTDLQVLVGTRQRDLSRGEAELAVQSPRPRQVGLVASRIGRTRLYLYASRTLATGLGLQVKDLATAKDLPLLAYMPDFYMLQDADWLQPILASGRVFVETNSTHALLEAARASVGIAVLPRLVARVHDDLVAVSEPVSIQEVWLVTHPEFRRDPKVRATADFLKRIAAGPGGLE